MARRPAAVRGTGAAPGSGAAPGRDHHQGGVQVISRVTAILRALADAPSGLGIAELSRIVGLPRSTVYRIVATLADDGFVTNGTGRRGLRLGPELAHLAAAAQRGLAEAAHPHMEKMANNMNETVDLAVFQHGQVRFVDQVVGNQRLRAEVVIGELFPAYCTANGKAFLAALPDQSLDAALAATPLIRRTPHTVVRQAELRRQLDEIRETGVAFDREEHTPQICAVGAVIRDQLGRVAAAITIATPAARFYGREAELAAVLLDGKEQVEASL
ncbi:MAG: IclR family transcriptional regulator [Acidimicrobiales bacterium]